MARNPAREDDNAQEQRESKYCRPHIEKDEDNEFSMRCMDDVEGNCLSCNID